MKQIKATVSEWIALVSVLGILLLSALLALSDHLEIKHTGYLREAFKLTQSATGRCEG